MKDFDFDELDRAVNSVLAKKDEPDTQDQPNQDVADAGDTNVPVSQPTNNADDSQNDQVTVTTDSADDSTDEGDAIPVSVNVDNTETDHQESQDDQHDDVHEGQNEQPETIVNDVLPPSPADEPVEESLSEEQAAEESEDVSEEPTSVAEGSDTSDASDDSEAPKADSDASATSLASIPVKRGRFMDVMSPQSGDAKKPMVARGGVTLTPSADFTPAEPTEDVSTETVADATATEETPNVEESTVTTDDEPNTESHAVADASADPTSNDETTTAAQDAHNGVTPFIPDVPVEKRPLNPLSPDLQNPTETATTDVPSESTEPVTDQVSVDPTLSANVPKEFDKDIMAVEANETVGESDETHADASSGESAASQPTDTANSVAMAATTAEPHPMFDTSTLGHTAAVAHHGSKLTWVVVGVSLFVVGAALGVLYFLYGQA